MKQTKTQTKRQTKLQNKNTANNRFGKAAAKKTAALVCTALVLGLLPNGGVIAPSEVYAQGGTATPSEPEGERPELETAKPETEIPETEEGTSEGEAEKPEEESKSDLPEMEATPSVPEETEPELEPDAAELLEIPNGDLPEQIEKRNDNYFTFAAWRIWVSRADKENGMLENPFVIDIYQTNPTENLLEVINKIGPDFTYRCELDLPGFHLNSPSSGVLKAPSHPEIPPSVISIEADDLMISSGIYDGELTVHFSSEQVASYLPGTVLEETLPIRILYYWYDRFLSNRDGTHIDIGSNGQNYPCDYFNTEECPYCGYQRISITKQPENIQVKLGETAEFEIADTHDSHITPTYQWQFSDDWGDSWTDINDANQCDYTIPAVSEEMDGRWFRCKVINGKDIAISETAELIIGDDAGSVRPPENKPDDNGSSSDSNRPSSNDRPSSSSGGSRSTGSSRSNVTVTIYERPNGKWTQDADGAWSFAKPDGTQVKNEWYECVWNGVKNWYFFGADGKSQKGWLTAGDGNTYFLHDKNDGSFGAMYTGWHWIDGKCYYFNTVSGQNGLPYGALLKSGTTPDGYTVNAEGQWTKNGKVVAQ